MTKYYFKRYHLQMTVGMIIFAIIQITNIISVLFNRISVINLMCIPIGLIGLWAIIDGLITFDYFKHTDNQYELIYQKELFIHNTIGNEDKTRQDEQIHFENYSEWKEYLSNEYKMWVNNEDFYFFMKKKARAKYGFNKMMSNIIVPFAICMVTTIVTMTNDIPYYVYILIFASLVLLISIYLMYKKSLSDSEIYFIKDFCKIVFPDVHDKFDE